MLHILHPGCLHSNLSRDPKARTWLATAQQMWTLIGCGSWTVISDWLTGLCKIAPRILRPHFDDCWNMLRLLDTILYLVTISMCMFWTSLLRTSLLVTLIILTFGYLFGNVIINLQTIGSLNMTNPAICDARKQAYRNIAGIHKPTVVYFVLYI